ncbi:NXF1 factor, partial [Nothoprocta ornata]|nr:NXF1 factor [Nothoprocta ornata]
PFPRSLPYGPRPSRAANIHITVRRDLLAQERGGAAGTGSRDGSGARRSWFKITIPYGKKYDKSWLLSSIQNLCSVPFTPVEFHYDHNRAQFYVEDATTASALKQVSRKITDRDNYKVVIIINSSAPPQSLQNELKPEEIEQVKLCMSKRYDGSQKSLDLKSLRTDPDLVSQSIDVVLNQRSCMQVVLRIIEENIPEVRAASRRDLGRELYYSIYDSSDRQGLLDAYHDGACCSLSIPFGPHNPPRNSLNEYFKDSRNVKKLKDPTMRFKLLKHTRLNVVAFLNELPKTQHDVNSFVVDVCAQTNTLLCFAVHGIFKEVDGKSRDSVRAFTRMFIAVPAGNTGLCIVNDELFVRNASTEELRKAFAMPAPTPSSSPVPTLAAEQQEMLAAFAMQSGMNLEWSQK